MSPDSITGDNSLWLSLANLDTIQVQIGRSKRTGRIKNVAEFLPSTPWDSLEKGSKLHVATDLEAILSNSNSLSLLGVLLVLGGLL